MSRKPAEKDSRQPAGRLSRPRVDGAFLAADDELLSLERKYRAEGFVFIAGIDEAGRGPLAGPVVAAAVVFPPEARIPRVFDSKQLGEAERRKLREEILSVPGVRWAIVESPVELIDRLNILRANDRAMREAARRVGPVDLLLVDGRPVPQLPYPSLAVVKGDAKSASIAAASILAKVYRDELMVQLDALYPGYALAENKGYGTAEHLAALRRLGPTPAHRKSFAPVRGLLRETEQGELF